MQLLPRPTRVFASVDHRQPEALAKSGFPINSPVTMCEIGDYEIAQREAPIACCRRLVRIAAAPEINVFSTKPARPTAFPKTYVSTTFCNSGLLNLKAMNAVRLSALF